MWPQRQRPENDPFVDRPLMTLAMSQNGVCARARERKRERREKTAMCKEVQSQRGFRLVYSPWMTLFPATRNSLLWKGDMNVTYMYQSQ